MPTYKAYPEDTIHTRAIARYLDAKLCSQAATVADYLIFYQRENESAIDPESLGYFRSRGQKRGDKIVFLPSCHLTSKVSLPNWLHIVDFEEFEKDGNTLRGFANRPKTPTPLRGANVCSASAMRELFLKVIGAETEDDFENVILKKPVGSHFTSLDPKTMELFRAVEIDDFYYFLTLIRHSYAARLHEFNKINPNLVRSVAKEVGSKDAHIAADLGARHVAKFIVNAADALCEAMVSPVLTTSNRVLKLLIMDDDVNEGTGLSYGRELLDIADYLFPKGCEIWVWNPLQEDQRSQFKYLRNYGSFAAIPTSGSFTIRLRRQRKGKNDNLIISRRSKEFDIKTIANDFTFVLVDQLYQLNRKRDLDPDEKDTYSRGTAIFYGPALIRGLKRMLHDAASTTQEQGQLPQVLALSRTDNPPLVQEAIRNGARDYVLKAQLLRLPAVMAKIQSSVGEYADSLHRNFPELYRLPNETQGLLRQVKIPRPAEGLHRESKPHQARSGTVIIEDQVSQILCALPKPDLHVHVGSCMSPEFLLIASLVGLVCSYSKEQKQEHPKCNCAGFLNDLAKAGIAFQAIIDKSKPYTQLTPSPALTKYLGNTTPTWKVITGESWLRELSRKVKQTLCKEVMNVNAASDGQAWSRYQGLRALLHGELRIKDRLNRIKAARAIGDLSDIDTALFGLRYSKEFAREGGLVWTRVDLIRIYLLKLGSYAYAIAQDVPSTLNVAHQSDPAGNVRHDFFDCLRSITKAENFRESWEHLCYMFAPWDGRKLPFTVESFGANGWQLKEDPQGLLRLQMNRPAIAIPDHQPSSFTFESSPLEYTLATGLRSTNLLEYLQGCEFSGAEHLRHPFLIHLYAQQALFDFIRKGIFYSELRASPDGYTDADLGFEFPHACRCLAEAFSEAQRAVIRANENSVDGEEPIWVGGILGERYNYETLKKLFGENPNSPGDDSTSSTPALMRHLPCKVSLIYVGKRHKPTRDMILEAAAAAVMRPSGAKMPSSAKDFMRTEFSRCRVVGFDLAGNEVGNPPERFIDEFSRLSRLHIPLTVHAGENESAQFVEDSIIKLGAHRIGHGLSLIEDKGLMVRVREDRIGIELCPISNHQTSHFNQPEKGTLRPYPLRQYISSGVLVSINTDNPIISCSNMVKEFFQASYAWGDDGMPLWEALRLIRMGYVMSFLSLPERRAMLEIVGQYLFDLFSNESVLDVLRSLSQHQIKHMSAAGKEKSRKALV